MWLVRIALRRPYTFVVMAMLIVILGVRHHPPDADRHLPGHRHPGHLRGLELRRPARPRRWRSASSPTSSASSPRPSTTSSTSRASRSTGIAVIKIFFQPGAQHRGGDGAGHRDLADRASARCRRARRRRSSSATARRTCRSCRLALESDSLSEQQLFDYGDQLHPRRHRDDARARRSPTRTAASSGRSWSTSTRSGSTPGGSRRATCTQRHRRAEPDPARRAPRRSATKSTRSSSTRSPEAVRRDRRPADQDRERHDRLRARRRQRARRLRAADQHGARRGASARC